MASGAIDAARIDRLEADLSELRAELHRLRAKLYEVEALFETHDDIQSLREIGAHDLADEREAEGTIVGPPPADWPREMEVDGEVS